MLTARNAAIRLLKLMMVASLVLPAAGGAGEVGGRAR
jgi:hypothetical protein